MKFNSQKQIISIGFDNQNSDHIDNSNNQEFLELQDRVKSLSFNYYDYIDCEDSSNNNNNNNISINNSNNISFNNSNNKLDHNNSNNINYDESPSTSYDSDDDNDVYTDDDYSDDYEDYFDSDSESNNNNNNSYGNDSTKLTGAARKLSIYLSKDNSINISTTNNSSSSNNKVKKEISFNLNNIEQDKEIKVQKEISFTFDNNSSTSSLGDRLNSSSYSTISSSTSCGDISRISNGSNNKSKRSSTHIMEGSAAAAIAESIKSTSSSSSGITNSVSSTSLSSIGTTSRKSGNGQHQHHHGHRRSKSCITSSSNKDYYYNIDLIFHKYSIREGDEDQNESIITNHALSDLKYINNRAKIFQYLINNQISDLKELSIEKLFSLGFKDFSHQVIPYEEMNEVFKYIDSKNELVRVLVALEFIFYHQNKHNHSHKCDYSNFIAQLFFDPSPVVFYCLTKLSNTYLSEKFNFKFIFQHEKIKDFFNDNLISVTERENRIKLFKSSGFTYHHGTLKRSKKKNHDFEKKLQKSFEHQKEELNDNHK